MIVRNVTETAVWRHALIGSALVVAGATTAPTTGQCVLDVSQKVVAPDSEEGDSFGWSVAISGDIAVVGVPHDDDYGQESGSAHVYHYENSSWVRMQKLTASEYGAAADFFGQSVAIDGDYIIVGAPVHDGCNGAAFVFHLEGSVWVLDEILYPPCGVIESSFGCSVSIDSGGIDPGDEVALVGAYEYKFDLPVGQAGAAYVYEHDESWTQRQVRILGLDRGRCGHRRSSRG